MRAPITSKSTTLKSLLWDMLTFEKLLTREIVHLIYWAGLGLLALMAFGIIGGAVGLALRGGTVAGLLIALPVLVGGFLVVGALVLLWRAACEFYVAVFRISDDLHALREAETPTAPTDQS